jgi:hypothetical protein
MFRPIPTSAKRNILWPYDWINLLVEPPVIPPVLLETADFYQRIRTNQVSSADCMSPSKGGASETCIPFRFELRDPLLDFEDFFLSSVRRITTFLRNFS